MRYEPEHYRRFDGSFVADLERSDHHVQRVAAWLRSLGYEVEVRPHLVRPSEEDMGSYGDDGDLAVLVRGEWERVEVKQRMVSFDACGAGFAYPTLIVDVAHAFDRAEPKPHAYVLTNRDVTACAVVRCSTAAQWRRTVRHDRYKNRRRAFYECPVRLVRFFSMEGAHHGSELSEAGR